MSIAHSSRLIGRRPVRRLLGVALSVLLVALLADELELDDHLYASWIEMTTPESVKRASVWLNGYLLGHQSQVAAVKDNLSGINYNPDTNSYWAIVNSPQSLIELDEKLQVRRQIALTNFDDTEALAYAGANRFVIADERDQSIAVAHISDTTTALDKTQLQRITLNTHGGNNKGFEGVAVDTRQHTIYVVRERDLMTLLTIRGLLMGEPGLDIETSPVIDGESLYLDDLSGLHFDQVSGNLLFLSDKSKALAEITPKGEKVSYMDLVSGFHGLTRDVPQAEGVTIGPDRSIHIVSEPNLVYRFKRTADRHEN